MSEKLIRLSNLSMTFEDGETILDGINLYINNKEFLTLLGPSGCGKTTTLRIIGGFLTPTSGDVFFNGQRINDLPAYKRKINTVFQRYALFPHLDVYDNIAFGLRLAKLPEQKIDDRVTEMLEIESRLCDVQYQIEALTNTQRTIDNDVRYSTFNLTLAEVKKFTTPEPETFGDKFKEAVGGSLESFGVFSENLLFFFIYVLPYLLCVAVVVVIVVVLVKVANKKKCKKEK